ncbi:NAD(P)/FAD-dependent oxidoreductase [Compostimonas suwonensis]|uniref:NADPH-dependent 2,4-dienoyl-CoA reductase/sulfur reductase-like enzyme n=1 Tax=Compostimonas suwonensis TaxID=1048394 RepID=A0A2M9BWS1_9MICO|nr:NAD(P)/FAD-dependent oxidoreductase [Compostimonas suwonensis]PJJ62406.1 NADPH-dependent 2,4-dienoyl-CoA reductase/sulfur reductase-like enzyme [Compostimonas suwonensis]
MRIVVVGGSLGALRVVEALRARGYADELVVVGTEQTMPYSRPPLTKGTLPGAGDIESVLLRIKPSIANVEWRLGVTATSADLEAGWIELDTGERLGYDGLVIATGVRARQLPFDAPTVPRLSFRTYADYLRSREFTSPGGRIVCVGAGFVGCEFAATAIELGCRVTVVDPLPTPMGRVLGHELGAAIQHRHEESGIAFHMGRGVAAYHGADTGIAEVLLDDGSALEADLIVEALGTRPNTEWLAGTSLDISDGVLCDGRLRAVGAENVVVVGDVARFPNPLFDEVPRRVEHWTMVPETAKRAAATLVALLGSGELDETPFAPLPVFWSDQHVVRVQAFGSPHLGDSATLLDGDVSGDVAYAYWRGDQAVGVAMLGFATKAPEYRAWIVDQLGGSR